MLRSLSRLYPGIAARNMTSTWRTKSHSTQDVVLKYINTNTLRLLPVQQKLIEATSQHKMGIMIGSADELQLLQNIARLIKAKKTLDIGVFTGYSAMTIAMVLPDDGTVVACDVSEDYANIGKPFWKEAGVSQKIDLRIAPASETMDKLIAEGQSGTFDFAFIDADKPGYDKYYEQCLQLLRPGGVIALDNMLQGTRVAFPEHMEEDTVALRDLTLKLHKDDRVDISLLTVGDGTMLAFKK